MGNPNTHESGWARVKSVGLWIDTGSPHRMRFVKNNNLSRGELSVEFKTARLNDSVEQGYL
jgi:hypothetical protein